MNLNHKKFRLRVTQPVKHPIKLCDHCTIFTMMNVDIVSSPLISVHIFHCF